ncbi:hypothetical protein [Aliamphritea spongicola]|nr:hypothetical protein [Aliamphritea spongicola]
MKHKDLKRLGLHCNLGVFLQGVLLTSLLPHRLQKLTDLFDNWQAFLRKNEMSTLSACKSFAAAQDCIDHWVLGFENYAQLEAFIAAPVQNVSMQSCAVKDIDRVNPSKW